METVYRYKLENRSTKHRCPHCDKKTFVRYRDTQTGEYLPEQFGRCDREIKCSYHLNPYKSGYSKKIWQQGKEESSRNSSSRMMYCKNVRERVPEKELAYIPKDILKQTLQGYERNVFLQNLATRVSFPIDKEDVEKVAGLYYLGTVLTGYRAGAITFPFIDKLCNVRAIQVKQFDATNHTTGTDFLHATIARHHQRRAEPLPQWLQEYQRNDSKVSCLFGEHLMSKYKTNPVALVEAPKTAIYGTLYFGFPEQSENLIWLAVYNLSSLNFEKCKALQGKDVYLFPDLSKDGAAFQLWSRKAKELTERMPGSRFEVSDLLENLAPAELKEKGADIADVLTELDWKKTRHLWHKVTGNLIQQQFEKDISSIDEEPTIVRSSIVDRDLIKPNTGDQKKTVNEGWGAEIKRLQVFFASIKWPQHPFKLNSYSTITNVSLFLESHFATLEANNGKRTFLPFLHRLQELRDYLKFNNQ